jgi:membrane protease YdiL (CAAX protease family)
MTAEARGPARAVAAGLALSLGGPALLALGAGSGGASPIARSLAGQLALWSLVAGVVGIALAWERRPLASLGIRPLRPASFAWGLAAAAVLVYAVVPAASAFVRALGLAGFEAGLSAVHTWPLWLRALAVLTGGVAEELLYRGYAQTRLEQVTGSPPLAAVLSVLAFALAHGPLWGPGPVVTFVFSGGFLAALFLWRRDLLANVVAHVTVDALGLVLGAPV